MPERIKDVQPPRGLTRLAFRLPLWLYRLGLGRLLGNRFVCLTHTGRWSGKPRQTVLEVVHYDRTSGTCIVAAGFGEQSDWVRNVAHDPHILFTIGRIRSPGLAERFDPETGAHGPADYARRYPLDTEAARIHLASSTYLQMALQPEIIHIVGHSETDHAANANDVITASKIARRAIENAVHAAPDPRTDPRVQRRKDELVSEARITLEAIHTLAEPGVKDPWSDADTLASAVTSGILDAPQLKNNRFGRGAVRTQNVNGMCLAVDPEGHPLSEKDRLAMLRKEQA